MISIVNWFSLIRDRMCKMAKRNSKSVRLSDTVLKYIEQYEGEGFNQKFENIILYAMQTEDERRARLDWINSRIESQREVLKRLEKDCTTLSSAVREAIRIDGSINALRRRIETALLLDVVSELQKPVSQK